MRIKRTVVVLALMLCSFWTSHAQSDPKLGLILHYKLDGSAYDSSPSGNNGIVSGVTVATDRFGNPAGCYSFSGSDNYIQSDRIINDVTNTFTMSIWAQTSLIKDQYLLFPSQGTTTWGDASVGAGFFLMGSTLGVQESTPGYFPVVVSTSGDFSKWTQVIVVYSNQVPRLYLNGILAATGPKSPRVVRPSSGLHNPQVQAAVGGFGGFRNTDNPDSNWFTGKLDDIRIYNRALSEQEVKGLYDFESLPPSLVPRRASAVVQVVNGFVVGATITDPGYGYTNAPMVIFVGGGGSGATATATVSGGVVTGITITGTGSGYTNTPVIRIASPPFMPWLAMAISKVKVTQHVVLGKNYVLESSFNLQTWNLAGSQFTADDEVITLEFDADVTGRFFRIRQVP